MKAAVIGSPVSHSLSPAIFDFISLDQGRPIEYSSIEVKPDELDVFLKKCIASQEFVGFNVTLPLKELVHRNLTGISSAAQMMGAVNVIHFGPQTAFGHNTDVIGIEKTLKRLKLSVEGQDCLLWGAGGSAKAVAFVLGKLKARQVYVFNRGERGTELAKNFSGHFPETRFQAISSLDEISSIPLTLMVNATSLGMQGQESGEKYFSAGENLKFCPGALAFDLIYIPEDTDFLKMARARGLQTIGGIGMLIDQALATWEIWIAPLKDEERLHHRLKSFLKGILKLRYDLSPVYLTGFMGVGKSTIAQMLAGILKRTQVDTDKLIEETSKETIPQIFKAQGEAEFRRLEREAVGQASLKPNAVISLGGGALTQSLTLEEILKRGTLIYLRADPLTLDQRISQQGVVRPLLANLSSEERTRKISDLLSERTSSYEKAHIIIDTEAISEKQICFEIISKMGELS